jgi:hypothetical protein
MYVNILEDGAIFTVFTYIFSHFDSVEMYLSFCVCICAFHLEISLYFFSVRVSPFYPYFLKESLS